MEEEVSKKKKRPKKKKHVFGRIMALLGITVLCLALTLLGAIWVLEKGPSPTLTGIFCNSVRETSAIRWMSNIFLTDEELEQYVLSSTEDLETEKVNTSLIHVSDVRESAGGEEEPYLQVIDISYGTCKGKMLIVSDPRGVRLGVSGEFGRDPGLQLTDMVAKYNGIAGVNGGGFVDDNGLSNGSTPLGLVVEEGRIIYGNASTRYNVVGLDGDGILLVGTMTGQEAVDAGMKWGVSFVTHDGIASSLIINGEVQTQNLGVGVNPRTAIGQREDGALLLLVLDGRSSKTLGATVENVVDIMLQYGAVNAGNLDGGSSSVMVYDGEIINSCASITGPRSIPTGFIVLREEDIDG